MAAARPFKKDPWRRRQRQGSPKLETPLAAVAVAVAGLSKEFFGGSGSGMAERLLAAVVVAAAAAAAKIAAQVRPSLELSP